MKSFILYSIAIVAVDVILLFGSLTNMIWSGEKKLASETIVQEYDFNRSEDEFSYGAETPTLPASALEVPIPMAAPANLSTSNSSWSMFNLLLTFIGTMAGFALFVIYKPVNYLQLIICGSLSYVMLIIFLLTSNISGSVVFLNKYSLVMFTLFLVQIFCVVLSKVITDRRMAIHPVGWWL